MTGSDKDKQTLAIALDLKIPAKLPDGFPSTADFKKHVITTLLRMFNIEHTRNTVLGDSMVRGVSGGEKRRVSIAEMMVTRACILSWDNSTRGLDSSTAFDFARSIRILTDLYQTTTLVSLYQASERMFGLFDKVLVMDEGRQVYFGPANEARAYFNHLGFAANPRTTTPDFITACTDKYERRYVLGKGPQNAPHNGKSFADAWDRSEMKRRLEDEMRRYRDSLECIQGDIDDFRTSIEQSKRGSPAWSVYTIGFHLQLWALIRRQLLQSLQDRTALVVSWAQMLLAALIYGGLYFQLSDSSAATMAKIGVIFIAFTQIIFEAFSEVETVLDGRPVLEKHRAWAFHSPSALWIGQIVADQVFHSTRALIFCIIVYFMVGLVPEAGAFFIFYLLIVSARLAMTLVFRTIANLYKDPNSARTWAQTILTLSVLSSGFSVQHQNMSGWLKWMFWINAAGLGWSGAMENEFSRISFECSAESLIPSGPAEYNDTRHQTCTLAGSEAGSTRVEGAAYADLAYDLPSGARWTFFGIIMAITVVFLILNIIVGEFLSFGPQTGSYLVFRRPNAELRALNAALAKRRDRRRQAAFGRQQQNKERDEEKEGYDDDGVKLKRDDGGITSSDGQSSETKAQTMMQKQMTGENSHSIFTWENINYEVPTKQGMKQLLRDVNGYVEPGTLLALMGASGAGKSTLLDVLAFRKNIGVIRGDILIDGSKPSKNFQRTTSYAEQMDIHEPAQTVREAFRFSADMRQPASTPRAEKYAYVEDIINLLELEDLADCIIGTPDRGLTVEQTKRVTIGVELAAKLELLLVLDEPTSGLDSQSAWNIIRFLRKLATQGKQSIICTIHQPNEAIFESFDRLLLLQRGGRTVYFGDIGPDACSLRSYLASHGAVAESTDNVAEFMLEAIGSGSRPRVGPRNWADIWEESPEAARVKEDIRLMREERKEIVRKELAAEEAAAVVAGKNKKSGRQRADMDREYATGIGHQIRLVTGRMMVSYWRSTTYTSMGLINHVLTGLLNGLTFVGLGNSKTDLQSKIFIAWQLNVTIYLVLGPVETMFHSKRSLFFREQSSKIYNSIAFVVSMVMAELPYTLLSSFLFFLPFYFIPGIDPVGWRLGPFLLIVIVAELFGTTLGQALAALMPSLFISSNLNPLMMTVLTQLCGITIYPDQMPVFWRSWLYPLNPGSHMTRGVGPLMLHNVNVQCEPSELNAFTAPANMTCGEYMRPFFESGHSGYLVANDTTDCQYCTYTVGDEYFEPMGFTYDERWTHIGIFAAFIGSNILITLLACRFINYNKR